MLPCLRVPASLADSLREFFEHELSTLEITTEGPAPVILEDPGRRRSCTIERLQRGGRITCTVARAMAERLEIEMGTMGRLLDHLEVKIRDCELGCFE